jgi:glycerol-3-phosphate dehydrogenase
MNGQILQGPGTLQEVVLVLRARNSLAAFPLFAKLHRIVFEGIPVDSILDLDN